MTKSLVECWVPCVGSSIVVAACMAMFMLSPFRPTAQFGFLMSAGMLLALLSDFLLHVLRQFVSNEFSAERINSGGNSQLAGQRTRYLPSLPTRR
jgi:hypothetical protein